MMVRLLPGDPALVLFTSGAKIGHCERRQQCDQCVGKRPPGTSRNITAPKFSGELIEIFPRSILAFAQCQLQRRAVARGFGNLARKASQHFLDASAGAVSAPTLCRAVVNIFASAPILDHTGTPQLREMTRDTRLPHAKNVLQLGNGEFFLLEQQEQPQSRRIGQQSQ